MNRQHVSSVAAAVVLAAASWAVNGQQGAPSAPTGARTIAEADCTPAKLGSTIPVSAIGLPVSAVTLDAPRWHAEANGLPAYCSVEGSMAPVDKSPTARPIRFGVALPAAWSGRGAQLGGGGMNGTIPRLTGGVGRIGAPLISQGFATYGSDSGHQAAFGPPPGAPRGAGREGGPGQAPAAGAAPPTGAPRAAMGPPPAMAPPDPAANDWALNDEAIANLGYMQMKKTHDAAMVHHGAGLWRAAALQLLHRRLAGRTRGADRRAAVPGGLRRHRRPTFPS